MGLNIVFFFFFYTVCRLYLGQAEGPIKRVPDSPGARSEGGLAVLDLHVPGRGDLDFRGHFPSHI
jgi:hypothetical protein